MKILKTSALCALLSLCSAGAFSQDVSLINEPDYNKPKLFADLPGRIAIDVKAFENLLAAPMSKTVLLPLQGTIAYQGTVVYKSETPDNAVRSITIKSSNRAGSTLTFTRIQNTDNSISYKGRIISHKHGDAYEVTAENGTYYFIKKNLYDLFSE